VVRGRWRRLPRPAPLGDGGPRDTSSSRRRCRLFVLSAVTPCSSSRRRSPPLGGTGAGARRGYSLARVRDENGEREKDSTRAAKSEV
jgi:hypothetical protein